MICLMERDRRLTVKLLRLKETGRIAATMPNGIRGQGARAAQNLRSFLSRSARLSIACDCPETGLEEMSWKPTSGPFVSARLNLRAAVIRPTESPAPLCAGLRSDGQLSLSPTTSRNRGGPSWRSRGAE
jgi:hypothetical protein